MSDEKPIIIVKKVVGHGGHHGGAWKVAYADFITAMMAFFLVMWVVNSTDAAGKAAIAEYFNNPTASGAGLLNGSDGVMNGSNGILPEPFSPHTDSGEGPSSEKSPMTDEELEEEDGLFMAPKIKEPIEGDEDLDDGEFTTSKASQQKTFATLAKDIEEKISQFPNLKKALGTMEIQLEPDGMVVEIMDTNEFSMFERGSAVIVPQAREALLKIAALLVPFPNKIDLLGHTDAYPYSSRLAGGYSNWELSADRANAARRVLMEAGVPEGRIVGVIGRADKYPRVVDDPYAIANRRIAIKMRFDEEQHVALEQANATLKERQKKSVADEDKSNAEEKDPEDTTTDGDIAEEDTAEKISGESEYNPEETADAEDPNF